MYGLFSTVTVTVTRTRRTVRRALVAGVVLASLAAVSSTNALADPLGQITEFSNGLIATAKVGEIAPGADGNLWFIDFGTPAIGRITPAGAITEFPSGLPSGSAPSAIAQGPDGNVWFTDRGTTPAIGRITPSGQITEFSTGLPSGSSPAEIAPGPDGNLWFIDSGTTPAIGRITPGGQINEFTGLPSGGSPTYIAPGLDGNVWFTDNGTKALGRITPSGQINEFSMGLDPGACPVAIAPGTDGNVWFGDDCNPAIGRITPNGQITEFTSGLISGPEGIAAGADGKMWFVDDSSSPIGQITTAGAVTKFSSGLPSGSSPDAIAPGADGNLWFTDDFGSGGPAIGRIGAGAPAALLSGPAVSGAGRAGSLETCQTQWSNWAGVSPSASLYPFDGYVWVLDGAPIAGQTGQTYTPTVADVGHQLSCRVTATYPLPLLVTLPSETSTATTVQPPIAPPAISRLRVSPKTFSLAGRKVKGKCVKPTSKNRHNKTCRRAIKLTISYTLNTAATVTLKLKLTTTGRRVDGRCVKPTNKNKKHKRCTRLVSVPGKIARTGTAGANSFTFNGKIGGHQLGPGTYQLTATPAGGKPDKVTFKILP